MQKRNLPHIYPSEATFFVTFALKNAIPKEVLEKLKEEKDLKIKEIELKKLYKRDEKESIYKEEKRFFAKFDKTLEKYAKADDFLKNPNVANIIVEKIKEYDGKKYDLIAYCIMSNHVHLLFCTAGYENPDISMIMQLIKGGSSFLCNQFLNRKGNFWQKESYDHYVRNQQELENIEFYILENPVKAGLVAKWEDWKFSYVAT
jgi:REP element-mobilizing transposase RayT